MSDLATWVAKLAECGTSTEVAQLLRDEHICGEAGSWTRCPVANYLRVHLAVDRFTVVQASTELIRVVNSDVVIEDVKTPTTLGTFMSQFDMGEFRNLEGIFDATAHDDRCATRWRRRRSERSAEVR